MTDKEKELMEAEFYRLIRKWRRNMSAASVIATLKYHVWQLELDEQIRSGDSSRLNAQRRRWGKVETG
jgi:hypothetical protein